MSEMLLTAYNGAILGPIAKLLGWIMNGMYILMEKVGITNVGLSIILFTIEFFAGENGCGICAFGYVETGGF